MDDKEILKSFMNIFFCSEVKENMVCDGSISEHLLVYICSGEMDLIEQGGRKYRLKKGDAFFVQRNHKMHKVKHARGGEPFKGLFLVLNSTILRRVLSENRMKIDRTIEFKGRLPYVMLERHPFITGLFRSLELYFEADEYPSELLMENKVKEAVLTLTQIRPDLTPVLFDFATPWKIDLKEFMNQNFKSDLSIKDFAHYTGRSLSAFKKEFEDAFQVSPMRWIVRRRLEEARQLIEQQGQRPLDVYLRVGFKNLSHFSTAYKREFGYPPSTVSSHD